MKLFLNQQFQQIEKTGEKLPEEVLGGAIFLMKTRQTM